MHITAAKSDASNGTTAIMKLASVPLPALESPDVRLVSKRPETQIAAVATRNTAQRF